MLVVMQWLVHSIVILFVVGAVQSGSCCLCVVCMFIKRFLIPAVDLCQGFGLRVQFIVGEFTARR